MKKTIFIIFILSMLFLTLVVNCSKETEPPAETGYKRYVVIEFFTYHDCQNCPLAEKAIDSLFGIHGDSLVIIEYHVRVLDDTLTPCTTFVNDRETRYTVGGTYPTVIFDGVERHTGATGDLFSTFLNVIQDRFSKNSNLRFHTFDAEFVSSTSISFNIRIFSYTDVSGRLFFVLTEDSVVFKDSLYNFVARQVYPDENGMVFSVSEDDTFGTNGSISLSWQPVGDVWLNIFIQNLNNNTIYQGGSINLGKAPLVPYRYNLTVSPDTFQTGTASSATVFTFLLENTGSLDDDYIIKAEEIDHIAGWGWQLCAGGVCKIPDHGIIHDTLSISSQDSDTFTIDVVPNTTAGIEKINVIVKSAGDPTLADTIDIYTELQ